MSVLPEGAEALRESAHAVAQQSYARCLQEPDFFASLYALLLASDPAIPPMFERTEFPKQHRLLQHGLGLLLSYGRRPDPDLLDRIAARHGPRGIDVDPSLYPHFVSSLVEAVRRHDPACTDETAAAWREIVRPGIEFMQSRYHA